MHLKLRVRYLKKAGLFFSSFEFLDRFSSETIGPRDGENLEVAVKIKNIGGSKKMCIFRSMSLG